MSILAAVQPDGVPMHAVDRDHLSHQTMGDIHLACEVLGLFRLQVDNFVNQLRDAADEKMWFEAAHALKGSARCIGAGNLANLARDAEDLGFRPDGSAHDRAIEGIAMAVAEVKVFIDRFVAQAEAA